MVTDDSQNSEYILVVGLGVTGLSVVRFLHKQQKNIVVIDSRNNPPGLNELENEFPDVSVYLGEFDEAVFMGATQIVVSPGVTLKEPVIQHAITQGVDVVGDIELFAQQVSAPVIAVTGSNGKSTVISLLGEMARSAGINAVVGGNIGVPALEIINTNADLYILELSSFQLESLHSLKPVAAAVLNVSPDHMDRYESYDEYIETKKRVYNACKVAVVNRDDKRVTEMQTGQNFISGFTLNEPAHGDFGLREFNGEIWLCKGGHQLVPEKSLKISGTHNLSNALAALALGEAASISMQDMLVALKSFTGLEHRTQWVAEKNHVTWVNDSKGTNVGATLAAITGIQVKNKLILIAGGIAKDADFMPLRSAVCENVRTVVLIGKDAPQIENVLQGCVPVFYAKDMADAVHIAADLSHPDDTVLLSPACASFDMFDSYEHRGEMFVKEIKDLQ
ncbi:MAG: UDP-N-acetylmuramoyl-L-alanine--D-glutamate ligase [endosymbiont of Galathealinum brachiosum]|uniref:UDP-N-acetylmuramoylalanine--D-glutamate ligase n=1 Tax=endosymbiont of Galathealinum brachiosum TaxID=2200906 RepID=A0A370D9Z0_9GAMM|nr:MAG: UDP-N-acetylmuramoyl-L-alanine--D-glutamate ligase [endosymbiont of Galathealinum brachiosum]